MKKRRWLTIILAGFILATLPKNILAQSNPDPVSWVGGPIQVNPNDRALICATNLGSIDIPVTLELVDAITGVVALEQNATLGAAGGTSNPGACLDSATASRAIIAVLIGRVVVVNPQPLPTRDFKVAASLQVFSVDSSGSPVNYRYAALAPQHPPEPCHTGA